MDRGVDVLQSLYPFLSDESAAGTSLRGIVATQGVVEQFELARLRSSAPVMVITFTIH